MAQRLPLRLPLTVLQGVLIFVLSYPLEFPSLLTLSDPSIMGLFMLLGVVMFLPYSLLCSVWAIMLVIAANTVILLRLIAATGSMEPWHALGFVLVTLMAAFTPSLEHFAGLGLVLCGTYGLSLYRFGGLLAEQGLVIPVLLALVLVLYKKTTVARDQLRFKSVAPGQASSESATDALTGLPNRAQFVERVWRSMTVAQNIEDFKFAILFVDLDGFKPVNDALGHKAGDTVLVETARRLRGCLRNGDVVARYGGDEFTLLINQVRGKECAVRVAERVLQKVQEPILAGKRVQVGATVGISVSTAVHQSPEDLIRHADVAMYRAKSQGKGCYEVSDPLKDTQFLNMQAKVDLKVRATAEAGR